MEYKSIRKVYDKFIEDSSSVPLKTLKEIINFTSDIYYNSGEESPLLDSEFDKIFKHYKEKADIKDVVGAVPRDSKRIINVSHTYPELVGTIEKAQTFNEYKEWVKKISKKANTKNLLTIISLKEDGNSVTGIFDKNGRAKQWLTRGRNGEGADVSNIFKDLNIPIKKLIPDNSSEFGIKFEVVMPFEISEELGYVNPRSAVAGILSSLEGHKLAQYLRLVPISISTKDERKYITRFEQLTLLNKLNNLDSKHFLPLIYIQGIKIDDYEKMENAYNEFNKLRMEAGPGFDRPFDGVVIEIANDKVRMELGRKDYQNNFDIALKFPPMVKRSKAKQIIPYYGLSGRITPVVVFEPVKFGNGATCTKVSLSNYKRFKELNLHYNDEIIVEYRNDVLAYVDRFEGFKREKNAKKLELEMVCPICSSKLEINENETFITCSNPDCTGKIIGKCVKWLKNMNLKGIKENTIDKLVAANLITSIPSLYSLKEEDILKVEGFKEKSAKNIIETINSKKEFFDYEIVGSLQITNIDRKTAKSIFEYFTISDVVKLLNDKKIGKRALLRKLTEIDGIAHITANNFIEGFIKEWKTISFFKKNFKVISFKEFSKENRMNSKLAGCKFVFTGFRDKDLEERINECGATVTSAVSGKTSYVIVAAKDTLNTEKVKKAQELNIPVIDRNELIELLG